MRSSLLGVLLVLGLAGLFASVPAGAKEWSSRVLPPDERGQELYERHCLACHGAQAKGDGPLAVDLVAPLTDLSKGFGAKKVDDLIPLVLRGKGAMPGFEVAFRDQKPLEELTDPARWVLEYMAKVGTEVPRKPAPKPAAEDEVEEEVEGNAPDAAE